MWIVIKEIDNKQHYRLKRNADSHYRSKNKIEIWIVNFNYSLRYY